MEASERSYQDALCGALIAAMCYMRARHQHQEQQEQQQQQQEEEQQQQQHNSNDRNNSHSSSNDDRRTLCHRHMCTRHSSDQNAQADTVHKSPQKEPTRVPPREPKPPALQDHINHSQQHRNKRLCHKHRMCPTQKLRSEPLPPPPPPPPSVSPAASSPSPATTSLCSPSTSAIPFRQNLSNRPVRGRAKREIDRCYSDTGQANSEAVRGNTNNSEVGRSPTEVGRSHSDVGRRNSDAGRCIKGQGRSHRVSRRAKHHRPILAAEPLSTDWTQLEVIDLINDGTGLGFGIIGGRSTGVVVKTILPGGIADLDGHLHSGDHILQIGDVNVRGMGSEQVALVLRQSGSHVRLVVARSVMEPPQYQLPHAPVIPTHQLEDHMEHFNAVMAMEAGEHEQHLHNLHLHNIHLQQQMQLQQQHYQQQQQQTMLGSVQQPTEVIQDLADVDVFEVDLLKDSNGLGITIAGYVGGDNTPDEISGIFVKSITEGSAAALDGRVHVNDQIIEVDGNSLQGFSNHQAVEVLRNTSQMVRLKLVRFRHGPKYDKLQEYLGELVT
ncbi:multiple PDZ domain protein [Elysia marginata]|uniref:Multiple PDZ domain protein n=1 Tax=Elysia marginata TaxID=1093978 RepID=A0AAV4JJC7_9GAST|nr:multiple PDZ domain protein [Elysia marginata]